MLVGINKVISTWEKFLLLSQVGQTYYKDFYINQASTYQLKRDSPRYLSLMQNQLHYKYSLYNNPGAYCRLQGIHMSFNWITSTANNTKSIQRQPRVVKKRIVKVENVYFTEMLHNLFGSAFINNLPLNFKLSWIIVLRIYFLSIIFSDLSRNSTIHQNQFNNIQIEPYSKQYKYIWTVEQI